MKKKNINKCYRPSNPDSSVHSGSTFRFEKAKEQAKLKKVSINEIIKYTNEVLKKMVSSHVANQRYI